MPESPVAASALVTALEMLEGHPLLDIGEDVALPLLTPFHSTDHSDFPAEVDARVAEGFRTLKVKVEKRSDQPQVARAEPGAPAEIDDLGIEVSAVTDRAADRYGYERGQGVLITKADPGGIGSRAGLREGMLILQVAGSKVTTVAQLTTALTKADLAKGIPMLVREGDRQMFILVKKR